MVVLLGPNRSWVLLITDSWKRWFSSRETDELSASEISCEKCEMESQQSKNTVAQTQITISWITRNVWPSSCNRYDTYRTHLQNAYIRIRLHFIAIAKCEMSGGVASRPRYHVCHSPRMVYPKRLFLPATVVFLGGIVRFETRQMSFRPKRKPVNVDFSCEGHLEMSPCVTSVVLHCIAPNQLNGTQPATELRESEIQSVFSGVCTKRYCDLFLQNQPVSNDQLKTLCDFSITIQRHQPVDNTITDQQSQHNIDKRNSKPFAK